MPRILVTWEAELERIVVGGQPGQKAHETLISTNKPRQKARPYLKITRGNKKGGKSGASSSVPACHT
jgi:hypothetical protein